jgi:translocation and assembly module TamB
MNIGLRSASVSWDWRRESLGVVASLALVEQGQVRGSFQLPLPARFPAALDHKGPLQASLAGQVREKGLLTALFPGFIQESRGELTADLRVSGTWEEPKIEGMMKLAGAGAYLPTAGIHVKDLQLAMRLEKEIVRIDSFRALSGPGHIEGTALVRLKGWEVAGYQGRVSGERFQSVYLPELQILSSPNLTFEGVPGRLNIRGDVLLPELIIVSQPARAAALPSRDVVLEGTPKSAEKAFPLVLDVQVRMVLGERVLAKVEGIDAQLDGSIDLVLRSLDKITSRGEIRVVKGRYKAYGMDLEIARGRLFYSGGPVNQPTLDILAIRTVGDVRAGVTAGGILRAPVIKLYSEPVLPDVDILAYIVFGHPLGSGNSGEQAAMMAQVAGSLLSRGQSAALQEQIKNRLGLSTLELQTTGDAPGRMGYKQITVAPAGVSPSRQTAGISQTMLTVGKYLTPQLYFSYGRSLFTGGNLFRLRYDIFKQWQIETQTGSESGVDLYYKIDFN